MFEVFIQGPPASGKTTMIRKLSREPLPPGVELWDEAHDLDHDTDLNTFLATTSAWLIIATLQDNQTAPPEAVVFTLDSWDDQARVANMIHDWIDRHKPGGSTRLLGLSISQMLRGSLSFDLSFLDGTLSEPPDPDPTNAILYKDEVHQPYAPTFK